MKKLKVVLLLATLSLGFSSAAQADGLNLSFSFGHRRHHDYYQQRYSAPVVRYYDEDYSYRPRRRIVRYEQPVYYSRPRYYRQQSYCH